MLGFGWARSVSSAVNNADNQPQDPAVGLESAGRNAEKTVQVVGMHDMVEMLRPAQEPDENSRIGTGARLAKSATFGSVQVQGGSVLVSVGGEDVEMVPFDAICRVLKEKKKNGGDVKYVFQVPIVRRRRGSSVSSAGSMNAGGENTNYNVVIWDRLESLLRRYKLERQGSPLAMDSKKRKKKELLQELVSGFEDMLNDVEEDLPKPPPTQSDDSNNDNNNMEESKDGEIRKKLDGEIRSLRTTNASLMAARGFFERQVSMLQGALERASEKSEAVQEALKTSLEEMKGRVQEMEQDRAELLLECDKLRENLTHVQEEHAREMEQLRALQKAEGSEQVQNLIASLEGGFNKKLQAVEQEKIAQKSLIQSLRLEIEHAATLRSEQAKKLEEHERDGHAKREALETRIQELEIAKSAEERDRLMILMENKILKERLQQNLHQHDDVAQVVERERKQAEEKISKINEGHAKELVKQLRLQREQHAAQVANLVASLESGFNLKLEAAEAARDAQVALVNDLRDQVERLALSRDTTMGESRAQHEKSREVQLNLERKIQELENAKLAQDRERVVLVMENDNMKTFISQLKQQLASYKSQLTTMQAECDQLRAVQQETEQQQKAKENEDEDEDEDVGELRKRATTAEAQLQIWQTDVRNLRESVKKLSNALTESDKARMEALQKLSAFQGQGQHQTQGKVDAQVNTDRIQRQSSSMESSVMRMELEELRVMQASQLEELRSFYEAKLEHMRQETEKKVTRLSHFEKSERALEEALAGSRKVSEDQNRMNQDLEEAYEGLKQKLFEADQRVGNLEAEIAFLSNELQGEKQRKQTIQQSFKQQLHREKQQQAFKRIVHLAAQRAASTVQFQEALSAQSKENADLRETVNTLSREVETLEARLAQAEGLAATNANQQFQNLLEKVEDDYQRELLVLRAKRDESESRIQRLEKQLQNTIADLKSVQNAKQQLQEEVITLTEQINENGDLEMEVIMLRDQLGESKRRLNDQELVHKEILNTLRENEARAMEIAQAESEKANMMEDTVRDLEASIARLNQDKVAFEEAEIEWKSKSNKLLEELVALRKDRSYLQTQLDTNLTLISSLRDEVQLLRAGKVDLQEQIDDLKSAQLEMASQHAQELQILQRSSMSASEQAVSDLQAVVHDQSTRIQSLHQLCEKERGNVLHLEQANKQLFDDMTALETEYEKSMERFVFEKSALEDKLGQLQKDTDTLYENLAMEKDEKQSLMDEVGKLENLLQQAHESKDEEVARMEQKHMEETQRMAQVMEGLKQQCSAREQTISQLQSDKSGLETEKQQLLKEMAKLGDEHDQSICVLQQEIQSLKQVTEEISGLPKEYDETIAKLKVEKVANEKRFAEEQKRIQKEALAQMETLANDHQEAMDKLETSLMDKNRQLTEDLEKLKLASIERSTVHKELEQKLKAEKTNAKNANKKLARLQAEHKQKTEKLLTDHKAAIEKLSTTITGLETRYRTVLEEKEACQSTFQKQIELLEVSVKDKDGQINALECTNQSLSERIAIMEKDLVLGDELSLVEARLLSVRSETSELEHQKRDLERSIDELDEQKVDLQCTLDNLRTEKEQIDFESASLAEKNGELERTLGNLQARKEQLTSEIETKFAVLEEKNGELERTLDNLQGQKEQLTSEIETKSAVLAELEQRRCDYENEFHKEKLDLESNVNQLLESEAALRKSVDAGLTEFNRLTKRISELQAEEVRLESKLLEEASVLDQKDKSELQRIQHQLAERDEEIDSLRMQLAAKDEEMKKQLDILTTQEEISLRNEKLVTDMKAMKTQLLAGIEETDSLKKKVAVEMEEKTKLVQSRDEIVAECEQIRDDLNMQRQKAQRRQSELQSLVDQLDREKRELMQTCSAKTMEIASLKREWNDLVEDKEAMEKAKDMELAQLRQNNLSFGKKNEELLNFMNEDINRVKEEYHSFRESIKATLGSFSKLYVEPIVFQVEQEKKENSAHVQEWKRKVDAVEQQLFREKAMNERREEELLAWIQILEKTQQQADERKATTIGIQCDVSNGEMETKMLKAMIVQLRQDEEALRRELDDKEKELCKYVVAKEYDKLLLLNEDDGKSESELEFRIELLTNALNEANQRIEELEGHTKHDEFSSWRMAGERDAHRHVETLHRHEEQSFLSLDALMRDMNETLSFDQSQQRRLHM